nr:hypothetical protein [Chroomonas debatzensis]
MLDNKHNLSILVKDKTVTIFFLLTLLYIGLCTPLMRYTYYFLNKQILIPVNSIANYTNNKTYTSLQEKLILDLTYHKLEISPFPNTIIKLSISDEGKILGYRYCSVFYPSYFTHNQAKKVIDKEYLGNKKKITFHIVKVSYH